MLSPTLTGWISQYERMQRAYARLLNKYRSSIDYDDDLRHYFQDCLHLRDWIHYDKTLPLNITKSISDEFKAIKLLRIVSDLAIGCKHIEHTRTDLEGAYVTNISVTITPGQGSESFHIITLGDGSKLSGQDIAKESYAAWDTLLKKLGLIK